MVSINEWLPNPKGADAQGEWLEIFNNGSTSVNLSGWYVTTKSSKAKHTLSGTIGTGEYRVFPRTATKISFRNQDESVSLYSKDGKLVDSSGFLSQAPEGKSFNRAESGNFFFGDSTPGVANTTHLGASLIHNLYPAGEPLRPSFGTFGFLEVLLGSAVALTACVLYILKKNEVTSELFFKRDKTVW